MTVQTEEVEEMMMCTVCHPKLLSCYNHIKGKIHTIGNNEEEDS